MFWDEASVLFIRALSTEILPEFVPLEKSKRFQELKRLSAERSMNKNSISSGSNALRYSAEVVFRGIVFECPCSYSKDTKLRTPSPAKFRHSRVPFVSSSWSLDGAVDGINQAPSAGIGRLERKKSMRLTIRSCKICGGDFLSQVVSHREIEETLKNVPTRDLWPSINDMVLVLLGKLKSSVVNPFVFSANDVELHHVVSMDPYSFSSGSMEDEIVYITKVPWSITAVVSVCEIPAHPIYPAVRLDVFCSPLTLLVSMTVC
jgi:hypothetical protein